MMDFRPILPRVDSPVRLNSTTTIPAGIRPGDYVESVHKVQESGSKCSGTKPVLL